MSMTMSMCARGVCGRLKDVVAALAHDVAVEAYADKMAERAEEGAEVFLRQDLAGAQPKTAEVRGGPQPHRPKHSHTARG
eukprot:3919208-Prymnesium_polylepis.1